MADNEKAKGGGRLKLIIIIVTAIVLAVALSVAGTLFFLGDAGEGGAAESGESENDEHVAASYFELEDPLVVSIRGEGQRYAQVSIAIVMRENDVSDELEQHRPTLRSRLQSVMQRQDYGKLHGTKEKEELAETLLEAVNQVLEDEGAPSAERVLFTNFVMQ